MKQVIKIIKLYWPLITSTKYNTSKNYNIYSNFLDNNIQNSTSNVQDTSITILFKYFMILILLNFNLVHLVLKLYIVTEILMCVVLECFMTIMKH